jgi:hypothetical protein
MAILQTIFFSIVKFILVLVVILIFAMFLFNYDLFTDFHNYLENQSKSIIDSMVQFFNKLGGGKDEKDEEKGEKDLESSNEKHPLKTPTVQPSPSILPIQNPISSSKQSYCLVGEFESKRGCVKMGENGLCMSGQIFSSKELCMNPTLTPNQESNPNIFPLPPIAPIEPNELLPL